MFDKHSKWLWDTGRELKRRSGGWNYQIEKATNNFSHNNTTSKISYFDNSFRIDKISQTGMLVWWIKHEMRSREREKEKACLWVWIWIISLIIIMERVLKLRCFFVHFTFHKIWAKKWVKPFVLKCSCIAQIWCFIWIMGLIPCKFMREWSASYFVTMVKIYETKTYLSNFSWCIWIMNFKYEYNLWNSY